MYTAEEVRADLEHLYATLRASHYDLFAYVSEAAYRARVEEARASIDGPMSRLEATRLFLELVAFGNVGHAVVDYPVADYGDYARAGGTLIPLDLRLMGERAYIAFDYSAEGVLEPGAEVVALDGRPIAEWVDDLARYTAAERPYFDRALLESMFPRLVWLDRGRVDSVRVALRRTDGVDTTVMVGAVPVMEVERAKGQREAAERARAAELLGDGVAYLRPGPFYATTETETEAGFLAWVDSAFHRFIDAGAEDLILDLRGNPGGDNSYSDPIVAWFADEPFRFASRYRLKASPETRRVLEGLAEEFPGGISATMLEAMRRHEDGDRFDFELPMVEPRTGARFEGRVYVLVNRHSYSNAPSMAAIIQDHGFGLVIGEETADVPTSYASSARFTLPRTGIGVTYPKAYFVRPGGDRSLRGVVPDIALDYPVIPDPDAVLEEAIRRVLERRP